MQRKPTKESLKHLYCEKLLSSRDIAAKYGCDQGVILRRLRKFGIPIKHPTKEITIPENILEKLYVEEGLSTYKIAKKYHCDAKTVYKKLLKFQIPTRPRKVVKISRRELEHLYFKRCLSLSAIGKLYKCDPVAIFKKMRSLGFSLRKSWETGRKYPRYNFSGNLTEKAYLLGFRAGDLGVRQFGRFVKSIRVGCNSTKVAQITLIQKIFKRYGSVCIGRQLSNGVRNITATLNKSFSFLLPKEDKMPRWALKSKKYFLSFAAGYIDAEGSIGIYTNRAKFRVGSYDIGILRSLLKGFIRLGIKKAHLRLETKAGFVDRSGLRHNGDFWRITVNEKDNLLLLFDLIGPYLQHADRIRAMELARSNVEERNAGFYSSSGLR
ncbi:MAG: hypothetical protein Q8N65_00340 [bacterium]|nr:hypothetical protein [bacterium]